MKEKIFKITIWGPNSPLKQIRISVPAYANKKEIEKFIELILYGLNNKFKVEKED